MRKSNAEGTIEEFEIVEVSMIEVVNILSFYEGSGVSDPVIAVLKVVGRCLESCFVLGTRTLLKEAFSRERVKEVVNATASDGVQCGSGEVVETTGQAS